MTIHQYRTFGPLHGQDIRTGARKARDAAEQYAGKDEAVSTVAGLREDARRAAQRVAHGKGISKFARILDDLERSGESALAHEAVRMFEEALAGFDA